MPHCKQNAPAPVFGNRNGPASEALVSRAIRFGRSHYRYRKYHGSDSPRDQHNDTCEEVASAELSDGRPQGRWTERLAHSSVVTRGRNGVDHLSGRTCDPRRVKIVGHLSGVQQGRAHSGKVRSRTFASSEQVKNDFSAICRCLFGGTPLNYRAQLQNFSELPIAGNSRYRIGNQSVVYNCVAIPTNLHCSSSAVVPHCLF
ncbi:hypothetical protein FHU29_003299 [Hoyosella altamirensis]|uniref:Uncharacterized protein n=1 Tax=Hoyosella altamirensis TaxID=616997 RepID=A0A839RQL8_9ACTN|nr:hypothetical protein [Hoyosella altamirensis]